MSSQCLPCDISVSALYSSHILYRLNSRSSLRDQLNQVVSDIQFRTRSQNQGIDIRQPITDADVLMTNFNVSHTSSFIESLDPGMQGFDSL